jgi:NTP pyrophosphatase (non-canonical NTP hydrolase)
MENEIDLLEQFRKEMADKIDVRHDRYSPESWKTLDYKRLIWLLEGELEELKDAVRSVDVGNALVQQVSRIGKSDSICDNAIDIANYALFIWYHGKHK